jgi:hypothetical protein
VPFRFSASTALTALGVLAGIAIIVVAYVQVRNYMATSAAGLATGTVTINSRPDGASVTIDGVARGATPLKVSLPAGQHSLQLSNSVDQRTIPLTIEPGARVSQYVDLAVTGPAVSAERLEVTSDPPGAQVSVDGQPRGLTPLTVAAVGAGPHEVIVSTAESRVRRTVDIAKGATASVFASLAKPVGSAGWLAIKTPIELQILEGGKLMGSTTSEHVMLAAGRHDLELVNDTFGFRTTIVAQVPAGKTLTPSVALPNGTLSINAAPWAEVWLDGKSVGTTPLANLQVPIGIHEVVWRHPQLGERRQSILVSTRSPVRIGMEFGK